MDYVAAPQETPEVVVLLLGDAEVGKSMFLSRLSLGVRPNHSTLPLLHDSAQPHSFDITLYNRPYRLHFYDTSSPTSYLLLRPNLVILCYSIASRASLHSLSTRWLPLVNAHFNHDENLPVLLLGLQRDRRRQWTLQDVGADGKGMGKGPSVMPHEGLQTAQRMLCDGYAECSALTGELCSQVLEDVARMCAKTTTAQGAKSPGMQCALM